MKNYFEYDFDDEKRKELLQFYEDVNISQHNESQILKSNLKLKRIKKLVNFNISDKVLDIGCSSGNILKKLSDSIKSGIGIDISKNIINKRNDVEKITYQLFDGVNIEIKDFFDKILMLDILEHAFEPDALMLNVREKLAEEGILIMEVPFSGWFSELVCGKYHEGHLRYYDPIYLKKYLTKIFFVINDIKIYNSVPFSSLFIKYSYFFNFLNWLCNLIPSKLYPWFGEIIIICKKEKI